MNVRVITSARLHLGLLDLCGDMGRIFGGIGLAIDRPRTVLHAESASQLEVRGLEQDRTLEYARQFMRHHGMRGGARIEVSEAIPAHVGLGSGTQLALAVGTALSRLHGLAAIPAGELAVALGRGTRSAIGLGAFSQGGFLVDGGHATAGDSSSLPPLILRHRVPRAWTIVVAIPHASDTISGEREAHAFRTLPPCTAEQVGKMVRLVLLKALPALVEAQINPFGEALTEIQQLTGAVFAPVQGGRTFTHLASGALVEQMLAWGACSAGQSSWGPSVYGLLPDEPAARLLVQKLQAENIASVYLAHVNNLGATIMAW